jgi:hypothetical protein
MSDSELVDRARQHRSSGAVLKIRVSAIRSRDSETPILIVEGASDIGPYEVWIDRIDTELNIEFLGAAGKSQILDFRRRLMDDRVGLKTKVFMCVDRDFDDLRGQQLGTDLFCTSTYSIENVMVSERVLKSILTDEARCAADTSHRGDIVRIFQDVLKQFFVCMKPANNLIFRARRLGIRDVKIVEAISKYVRIALTEVTVAYENDTELQNLVKAEHDLAEDEFEQIDMEFESLDPHERYRGKFLMSFFLRWLDLLALERGRAGQTLFPETAAKNLSFAGLTLRSLASRSQLPEGLKEFVLNIKAA